ncbi:hypothetical protein AAL_06682 [Moelleriella libera RCEF 2490]|uniref:NADH dehydrogenase [ubiquinone] 1 beta subcomplex subunit 11, mitochondrial n=1 Tax=Moelleriella libera RCEF 2490 TaxID=1081109 RepID=A0A167YJZ3_9HYPO|nr:hypothetical protein AAL_06682 [Moelleriella libera RCEF 2490]
MGLSRTWVAPLRGGARLQQHHSCSAARWFSASTRRAGGGGGSDDHGHHGSQFEPPTGWLWGIKPGEKAEPEGWEWPMYVFGGSLVVAAVALAFKPDTSVSTWALEEARRRLEAEGVLPDPSPAIKKE